MVAQVTGRNDGNGRKMIMKMPKARAKRLIGVPQRPRRKGAFVGFVPRHLPTMKKVIGIRYDRYNPTVDKDRIASSAAVDPRLMSMISIITMLLRPSALVGIRSVGWT